MLIINRRVFNSHRNNTTHEKPESLASEFCTSKSSRNIETDEQMRRAVRDYKYEVNESRMTEECSQYLAQLQKDWERHRVKIGVEAMRKEVRDFGTWCTKKTILTPALIIGIKDR